MGANKQQTARAQNGKTTQDVVYSIIEKHASTSRVCVCVCVVCVHTCRRHAMCEHFFVSVLHSRRRRRRRRRRLFAYAQPAHTTRDVKRWRRRGRAISCVWPNVIMCLCRPKRAARSAKTQSHHRHYPPPAAAAAAHLKHCASHRLLSACVYILRCFSIREHAEKKDTLFV